MYSLAHCLRDIKHLDTVDPQRKARAEVMIHDLLLGLLLMMIASLMLYGVNGKKQGQSKESAAIAKGIFDGTG